MVIMAFYQAFFAICVMGYICYAFVIDSCTLSVPKFTNGFYILLWLKLVFFFGLLNLMFVIYIEGIFYCPSWEYWSNLATHLNFMIMWSSSAGHSWDTFQMDKWVGGPSKELSKVYVKYQMTQLKARHIWCQYPHIFDFRSETGVQRKFCFSTRTGYITRKLR